jgi:hypothetical protein
VSVEDVEKPLIEGDSPPPKEEDKELQPWAEVGRRD